MAQICSDCRTSIPRGEMRCPACGCGRLTYVADPGKGLERRTHGSSVISSALVIDIKGTLSTPGGELACACVVRFKRSAGDDSAAILTRLAQAPEFDPGIVAQLAQNSKISLLVEASAAAPLAEHLPLRAGLSGRTGFACRLDVANWKLFPDNKPMLGVDGSVSLGPITVSREHNFADGIIEYTLAIATLRFSRASLAWEVRDLRFTAPDVVVSTWITFRPSEIRWTERPPRTAGPPKLLYLGLVLFVAVQIARASGWSIPLLPSYGVAFAIAFAVAALGAADAIYVRQNALAATGVLVGATGIVGLGFDWTLFGSSTFMPVAVTGVVLFILGAIPALLGVPALIMGTITLVGAVIGAAAGGIQAVPPMVWVTAVVLLGMGSLMMKRQKRLMERGGAFVPRK